MKIDWIEKYLTDAEQLIYDNRVNEGLELMNRLLYDEPGYGYLHNHLGWAYLYYTEDSVKAELHLKLATQFASEYPAPYMHLGNLYIRLRKYEEAICHLKVGLNKPGANRVGFLETMGQAYELLANYGKAIAMYREGVTSSVITLEVNNLNEHIKRCRKKRWSMMFSFLF